jgi:hypothetical protein
MQAVIQVRRQRRAWRGSRSRQSNAPSLDRVSPMDRIYEL